MLPPRWPSLCAALCAGCCVAAACTSGPSATPAPTPRDAGAEGGGEAGALVPGMEYPEAGLRVAFVGDTGLGANTRRVMELAKAEGAHLVLHLGDFDYADDPPAWEQLMSETLGDLPWLAVVGNHDVEAWTGYADVIQRRTAAQTQVACQGDPGVQQTCSFRGLHVLTSGVGLLGSGHEAFLAQHLAQSRNAFRLCAWHLNQRDFQLGSKSDETGFEVHKVCQAEGALIVNGHEHSYGRTLTLADVGNAAAGHGALPGFRELSLALGRTAVIVNGAGGQSFRPYTTLLHDDDTWWAGGYTMDTDIRDGERVASINLLDPAGIVILEFGVDGDRSRARGWFKTIGGVLKDEWTMSIDARGMPTAG